MIYELTKLDMDLTPNLIPTAVEIRVKQKYSAPIETRGFADNIFYQWVVSNWQTIVVILFLVVIVIWRYWWVSRDDNSSWENEPYDRNDPWRSQS